jgi:hypothetical protein
MGIIVNPREFCCALYFREEKDIHHLFFNCEFSKQMWRSIFKWLPIESIPFEGGRVQLDSFGALVKGKKACEGWTLILVSHHLEYLASSQ